MKTYRFIWEDGHISYESFNSDEERNKYLEWSETTDAPCRIKRFELEY